MKQRLHVISPCSGSALASMSARIQNITFEILFFLHMFVPVLLIDKFGCYSKISKGQGRKVAHIYKDVVWVQIVVGKSMRVHHFKELSLHCIIMKSLKFTYQLYTNFVNCFFRQSSSFLE